MIYSRFKQIKEAEARRKRQREEEKRKAEEAAAKGTQIANERHESENEAGVDIVAENNETSSSENTTHNSSSGVTVNGSLSRHDLKENQNTTSTFQMADNEVSSSSGVDGKDKQQSYKDLGKV